MTKLKDAYRRIRKMKWLSEGSFLLCAVTFSGVFAILHIAGGREHTAIFSGNLPAEWNEQVLMGFVGVLYTFFYMMAVILAPILTIAAAIFYALNKRFSC